jgi:hypothetical protein
VKLGFRAFHGQRKFVSAIFCAIRICMEQEMVHGIIFMQQNQGEISETDFLKKSLKHCLGACYGNS